MQKLEIEEERRRIKEFYGRCVLIIQNDGSAKIVEPDGTESAWELDDSMKYRGYFRDILARDIFKDVIVKE
ncbi:hypothetical protein H0N98_01745 [Candidatus Micrarchaeota archaeon]|nr:hypothetical protein [Candidatus Micrarchaeota archaeon]